MKKLLSLGLLIIMSSHVRVLGQGIEKVGAMPTMLMNFMIAISPRHIIFNLVMQADERDSDFTHYIILEQLEYSDCLATHEPAPGTIKQQWGTFSKFRFSREKKSFSLSFVPSPSYSGSINLSGMSGEKIIQMAVMDLYGRIVSCRTLCMLDDMHPFLTELLEKRLTNGDYLIRVDYAPSLLPSKLSMN